MLKSFFFIPAGNKRFYSALTKYHPDFFVFDLEDSIESENVTDSVDFILNIPVKEETIFVRLWSIKTEVVSHNITLFAKYRNYILPKVESSEQLDLFFNELQSFYPVCEFRFLVIIESPIGIVNLNSILNKYHKNIYGIGFGSHDYCNEVGAVHSLENYSFARNAILLQGKAFGKLCLDIASTNIQDEKMFINECKEGFNLGFDAKPILHPWQLIQFQKINYYSDDEINDAHEVSKQFGGFVPLDIAAVNINGRILEKPHIRRLNRVIDYILKRK